MKRVKTDYPGVFFREADRIGGKGKEKVYYAVYKKHGKVCEEKCGRQYSDDMTPSKANVIRCELIEGKRIPKAVKRKEIVAKKWTIAKLWEEYEKNHEGGKSLVQDECRYNLYLKPDVGAKEPSQLVPLDVKRIELKLLKTKSAGSVKNVLELLRRLINYGRKMQLCAPASFQVTMPAVNNITTEDLDPDQMQNLLRVLRDGIVTEKDGSKTILDLDARQAMLLALLTGMRKGEIFKLTWDDIDSRRGFITIRDPKGKKDQTIPLSDAARELLENRTHVKGNPFIFPGKEDSHRVDMGKHFRAIRAAAKLPADFRPMHGLRHAFASNLASSGQVDLYTISKLLTHKSPVMTQRYAHLRDQTLRNASNLAGDVLKEAQGGRK